MWFICVGGFFGFNFLLEDFLGYPSLTTIITRFAKKRWYNPPLVLFAYLASLALVFVTYPLVLFHAVRWYVIIIIAKGGSGADAEWCTLGYRNNWYCLLDLAYLHLFTLPSITGYGLASSAYSLSSVETGEWREPGLALLALNFPKVIALAAYHHLLGWPLGQLQSIIEHAVVYQDSEDVTLINSVSAYVLHECMFGPIN